MHNTVLKILLSIHDGQLRECIPFPQMECIKVETASFFSGHAQDLATLRETATEGLGTLKTEHDKLKEQISRADKEHQTVRPGICLELCSLKRGCQTDGL